MLGMMSTQIEKIKRAGHENSNMNPRRRSGKINPKIQESVRGSTIMKANREAETIEQPANEM
jgi:hypothetical protein